jgi:uncharacterized protein YjbJ (UPF0337 family)
MTSLIDRILGRTKKAAGDIVGDSQLRHEGVQEERKADAKDELAHAEQEADRKAQEVADLERKTAQ